MNGLLDKVLDISLAAFAVLMIIVGVYLWVSVIAEIIRWLGY